MYRSVTSLALVALALLAPPARGAGLSSCTVAIGKAVGTYTKSRQKTIAKCEDKRAKGSLPASAVCRPQCDPTSDNAGAPCRTNTDCTGATPACLAVSDAPTSDKLAKAAAKASSKIEVGCSGLSPLPPIGPACDESAGTALALATCITDPVQDTGVEIISQRCAVAQNPVRCADTSLPINVDTLAATIYDASAPVADTDLRKCQAAISKESGKYLSARYKAGRKCHEKLAHGSIAGPCPDPETADALEALRAKLDAGVRKKCTEAQLAADTAPKLDFGIPCELYKLSSFRRDGTTNDNLIPVLDRFVGCLADETAGVADGLLAVAYPRVEASSFALGVAAGDATDTAAVFWTRLPDPGMGAFLDVSTDPTFASGVQTLGIAAPDPGDDGTVKEEVTLLAPFTTYYYRFRQGSETSATGRLRTAPSASDTQTIRLGWTGDANAFFQPFSVLDPLRLQDADGWLFIGDTIYGDDPRADGLNAQTTDDYYAKYRHNRGDGPLRQLMASAGTYTMWDDHEVRNDFAGTVPAIATRLANGNHAFRRYNPIREDTIDPTRLYRSFRWGTVAEFFLIDVRQYRSAKYTCCVDAMEDGYVLVDHDTTCTTSGPAILASPACNTVLSTPGRTVLGAAQRSWLENALLTSTATFKFIMNGPPITDLFFQTYDFWTAWPEERTAILDYIVNNNIENVVWLSTDLHGIVISEERVDISPTHPVPEVVGGAIGMDPILREILENAPAIGPVLSSIPGILTQVTQFDIDRFNTTLITVAPGSPATATLDFYDRSGAVVQTITFSAAP